MKPVNIKKLKEIFGVSIQKLYNSNFNKISFIIAMTPFLGYMKKVKIWPWILDLLRFKNI